VPPYDLGRAALARESEGDLVVMAQCCHLDDIWTEGGRRPVVLVKIDVEGSEPEVLRGGPEFFSTCRPVVVCEVNTHKLGALGEKSKYIFEFINALNYNMFAYNGHSGELEEVGLREGAEGWYDILCVPRP
jgi:hypothetical protein